ncbi:MAG: hypothetical protein HZB38_14260 [Planctomycetes bacterium]|nr:hypothetical protein [Planctomycetota bacterium]
MNVTAFPQSATALPTTPIRIAYTPDSDDAFNYYAWEHGRVALAGYPATFHRDHIIALNRLAAEGGAEVVGISSAFYPKLAGADGRSAGRTERPRRALRQDGPVA